MDATFKVIPNRLNAYQLLTIHIEYQDHAYEGVFHEINRLSQPHWNPENILTDFEMAVQNAARLTWPGANMVGCFFHYAQAVYRLHCNLRLRPLTDANLEADKALDMLMALCLLPSNRIFSGFRVVSEYITTHNLHEEFAPLLMYMENYWLREIGANVFSVFGQSHRTNNALESFYSQLLQKMGSHPGVWDFTAELRNIEHLQWTQYLQISAGRHHVRATRRRHVFQNKSIHEACMKLEQGQFNEAQFLESMSHCTRGLMERLGAIRPGSGELRPARPDMPRLVANQDPDGLPLALAGASRGNIPATPGIAPPEDPPMQHTGDCIVCRTSIATHVVIPCGHMCICAGCVDRLQEIHLVPPCRILSQA